MEENIFDTELGRKVLALTKAGFKVSDLISDPVLRERIKTHILNFYKIFFSSSGIKNYRELINEIDVLDHLFFLSGHLNLTKDGHVRILRNGFLVFKSRIILAVGEVDKSGIDFKNIPVANDRQKSGQLENQSANLNARQEKIMAKFKNKNMMKLAEILEVFPGVSERTIRNELASLVSLGKITRSGVGNGSFYKVAN